MIKMMVFISKMNVSNAINFSVLKLSLCSVLFLLNACAPNLPKTSAVDDFDAFVASEAEHDSEKESVVEIPDAVSQALLDGANKTTRKSDAKRFDVSVNNIPALTFFVSLVSQAGVNVVAHPDIEGFISLDLRNVSIEEVLAVIRDVYGYEFKFESEIYTIYPRKLRTQIFQIDYLDVKRVGVTDTTVLIGNASSSSSSGSSSSNNSSDENEANLFGELGGERSSSNQGYSPGARVQTLSATNFWEFLQSSLLTMVGGEEAEGRFVMTNPQAGMVVVRALPSELAVVRDFLEKSELSIQRQVILETKILEVQLNEEHESGINWAAVGGALDYSFQDSETNTSFSFNGGNISREIENVSSEIFSSVLNVTDITKLINLLDRQGEVSVLSSPRISTVNNQKAVIRVGSDEFFVTGISNSTTASASAITSAPQVELSSFFSGISLDVTPQIAEHGDVILHVHPVVSEVSDQQKDIQVGDDNFSLPLALREVRESDSIVRAMSGQVVVLGGLMQESSSGVDTKRSRLGNIPILNIFFKHETKSLSKTELVILMRPIVVGEDTWSDQLKLNRTRLEQFEQN